MYYHELIYVDESFDVFWQHNNSIVTSPFPYVSSFPSGSIIIQNQMSFPSVDDKRKWSDQSLFRLFS